MKLKLRHIAFIMAVIYSLMLFPVVPVSASTEDREEGYEDGYSSGYTDGVEAALDDMEANRDKDYRDAMPSRSEIRDDYDLEDENNDYENGFISGYRKGFEEGYNYAFDNIEEEETVNYDETLGFAMGEIDGKLDFYSGEDCDWGDSIPSTSEIIKIFRLNDEPTNYKNDFLVNFKTNYKNGYESGYRTAKLEPYQLTAEQGTADGERLGGVLGESNGRRDYYSGYNNQWQKDLPSDEELAELFLLYRDSEDYRKAFIATFKSVYRNKYEEAYRKANTEKIAQLFEAGYNSGREIGMHKGESLASIDRLMNLPGDEGRYAVNENSVVIEYMLYNEDQKYKEGFLSGYRAGIKEGYTTAYQKYGYEYGLKKAATELVPISGLEVKSGDGRLKLNIPKGAYYNDVVVTIDSFADNNVNVTLPSGSSRMIKASGIYSVVINNYSAVANRDKTMKLSFDYYGPENAGIYMYTDEGWMYLPSRLDETGINTLLIPKAVGKSAAIYGVFIDEKAMNPYDLRGHWAKDEITAYLRRGILGYSYDNYFRPDAALNYNQAVIWINTVCGSQLKGLGTKDRPLTYTEAEKLFRQATGNEDFTWAYIADKMVRNKDKRSGSYSSMNGYITRAEAVYMLYYMME
ncbi:MAG TPA: hypothetical protein VN580_11200 [Clostridia bacterium]|nr:hypothetical protein [Clostridia bacterium]